MQAANLTSLDFCEVFHTKSVALGENLHVSLRNARRWLSGKLGGTSLPRPEARRVLEFWFGESAERLLGPPDLSTVPALGSSTGSAKEAAAAARVASG